MKKFTSIKNSMVILLSIIMCGGVLTACSNDSSSNSSNAFTNNGTSDNDNADVKVIRVGTGNAYNPACYLDDEGNIAGYDYTVLQAVDELLPQYAFTYETFDFQNVLLALESNKIDLAAHQYEWNEERGQNYLFGEEGYTVFDNYIWVIDDYDISNINSLEDFAGTTVNVIAGDNKTYYLEEYNKEHSDKQINLDYTTPSTNEERISYYTSGKWSFISCPKKDIELYNEAYAEFGAHFKLALDEPLNYSNTYFLYRKDDKEQKELKEAVDDALIQLKESGKLAEISVEYWGDDYTGSNVTYNNNIS